MYKDKLNVKRSLGKTGEGNFLIYNHNPIICTKDSLNVSPHKLELGNFSFEIQMSASNHLDLNLDVNSNFLAHVFLILIWLDKNSFEQQQQQNKCVCRLNLPGANESIAFFINLC